MHFHLPKPLHGWRAFAGEVGIIVVGVLVALGAEQVVESWHWRKRARDAEESIRVEISHNAGVYDERRMIQPCADRRIEEVARLINQVRRTHVLPEVGTIGRVPSRPTVETALADAIASGAMSHIADARRSDYAILYAETQNYDEHIRAEEQMWSGLRILEGAPGPISDAMLANAADTLARLRSESELNGVVSAQAYEHAIRIESIRPSYLIILDREGTRGEVLAALRERPLCKPLLVDGKPYPPATS